MQPEFEFSHHPEISSTAADRPEQIRVFILRGAYNPLVSQDNLGRYEIVYRQARLPCEPSHATAQSQSAYAGVAHHAGWHGEAVCLGGSIQVRQ
jgi:hypothetical protein